MAAFEKLVWSDEFDGNDIDRSVWTFEEGYIRNNELQYYTDSKENAYIKDGCLVLECKKTGDKDKPYTSASLNTLGKKEFLYGKLEMRAKLPHGRGVWPAFWSMGTDFPDVGHPLCGEIDIMELVGDSDDDTGDGVIYGTIHYPNKPDVPVQCTCRLRDQKKYADDFHIIGMNWTKDKIEWYVDDILYFERDISEIKEFHKPHFVLINLAMGGNWPGDPNENTPFPAQYSIDWIRYYQ